MFLLANLAANSSASLFVDAREVVEHVGELDAWLIAICNVHMLSFPNVLKKRAAISSTWSLAVYFIAIADWSSGL